MKKTTKGQQQSAPQQKGTQKSKDIVRKELVPQADNKNGNMKQGSARPTSK